MPARAAEGAGEMERTVVTLKGHTDPVKCMAFHPTLLHIVGTASSNGTAKLWNHETQECIVTLLGHTGSV